MSDLAPAVPTPGESCVVWSSSTKSWLMSATGCRSHGTMIGAASGKGTAPAPRIRR